MNGCAKDKSRVGDAEISLIHHALRAPRRRYIVRILFKNTVDHLPGGDEVEPMQMNVRDLSKVILEMEKGVSHEWATGDKYRNVYTSLSQTHLPLLDELRVIQYDADRQSVQPGRNLRCLAAFVSIAEPVARTLLIDDFDDTRLDDFRNQ